LGIATVKFIGKFQGNTDFTNTDCMQPDTSVAESGHCFPVNYADALRNLGTVSSTLPDAHEISGQEEKQEKWEKEIVKSQ
jgi:hypothetical protein